MAYFEIDRKEIQSSCNVPFEVQLFPSIFKQDTLQPRLVYNDLIPFNGKIQSDIIYDVCVIGAGVHGTSFSAHLKRWFPKINFLILDKKERFFEQLFGRCNNSKTKVFRSPINHQIAPDGCLQLIDYMRLNWGSLTDWEKKSVKCALGSGRSLTPVDLFIKHAMHIVSQFQLQEYAVSAGVVKVSSGSNFSKVHTESGEVITSKIVIVCTGAIERPIENPEISANVYGGYSERTTHMNDGAVSVYGRGMCAAHKALYYLQKNNDVLWHVNSPISFKCTDFPHKYTRLEGLVEWAAGSENYDGYNASIIPEFYDVLKPFVTAKQLKFTLKKKQDRESDLSIICSGLSANESVLIRDRSILEEQVFFSGPNAYYKFGPSVNNFDGARIAIKHYLPEICKKLEFVLEDTFESFGSKPIKAL